MFRGVWTIVAGSEKGTLLFQYFAILEEYLFSEPAMRQLCSNFIQFPARFLKHDSPPDPLGTTEISLSDNIAYERCNHEKDQTDDHQYEKLDEYQA